MNSKLIQRTTNYKEAKRVKTLGCYPFFTPIQKNSGVISYVNNQPLLMFGSNSYLGFNQHPAVIEASTKALFNYGTSGGGSRFLNGSLEVHEKLEVELAKFLNKEKTIVFSTGYQANLGVFSNLLGRNDFLIMDESIHASLIDGARLAHCKKINFKHNNIQSLEKKLKAIDIEAIKLIVVEGLYSVSGDLTILKEITNLAEKYNATILLDDAHGIGVFGNKGRGVANQFDLEDKVDLISGTFSKSLGSIGGFLAGPTTVIDFIKHHSRSLLFTASLSPANAAAALTSLKLMQSEPEHLEALWQNILFTKDRFEQAKIKLKPGCSPIFAIVIGDYQKTLHLASRLIKRGIFVNPIIHPAVAKNECLIRFSVTRDHKFSQIERAVKAIQKEMKRLGVLKE